MHAVVLPFLNAPSADETINERNDNARACQRTKIPPVRCPKATHPAPSPRCAMQEVTEDSQIFELGQSQQGKYEERMEEREGRREFIADFFDARAMRNSGSTLEIGSEPVVSWMRLHT
jgi:hypothetical protein